jgi:hypothetical protein
LRQRVRAACEICLGRKADPARANGCAGASAPLSLWAAPVRTTSRRCGFDPSCGGQRGQNRYRHGRSLAPLSWRVI